MNKIKTFVNTIIEDSDVLELDITNEMHILKLVELNQYIDIEELKLLAFKDKFNCVKFIIMSPTKTKRKILDILRTIYYDLFDIEMYEVYPTDKFIYLTFTKSIEQLKEDING